MRDFEATIERIKEGIDFPKLVAETVKLKRWPSAEKPVLAVCPWHSEKTGSLAVYQDHAHCFGCGWNGDAIDWLQERDGLDFHGALEAAARRAGVELRPMTPQERKVYEERRGYEDALGVLAAHWGERLRASPAAMEYAKQRWPGDDFKDNRLGYTAGGALPELGNERAQKVAQAINNWAAARGGAVVYVHREGARAVYLAARAIEGKGHYNPPADLAGKRRPYLNAQYTSRAETLLIVEGQACARTLKAWGFPALALAGSGATGDLIALVRKHLAAGALVGVIPDNDGKTNLETLAGGAGPLLHIITLPEEAHDVNGWAQAGATGEDFEAVFQDAKTWLDLRIEDAADLRGLAKDRATEEIFELLKDLPRVTQQRYKQRVTKALEIGARDFNSLLKAAQHNGQEEDGERLRYVIESGRHCEVGAWGPDPLCNFSAQITKDVALDDGSGETVRQYTVRGELDTGERLPAGRIDATKFSTMAWVSELWGVRAVVRAGRDVKDKLREAIQLNSLDAKSSHVRIHTGVTDINGEPVYLTSTGGIGANGASAEVELNSEFAHYALPLAPENPKDALRASLRFLDIAPDRVTVPLWAAMYLAPLAEIVYPDFVLWLYGKSGTLKSTMAALAMRHYGEDFSDKKLFSWTDTPNRLELNCFLLKDAPLVIDNFTPHSNPYDARKMESSAQRITHNVGSQTAKGRMRRDLSAAVTYRPRALVISTAEQTLDQTATEARIYTIEVCPDDLRDSADNMHRLTTAQRDESARYSHAMAGYIKWSMGRWEELKTALPQELRELESQAREATNGLHLRIPDAIALLYLGYCQAISYGVEIGLLDEMDKRSYLARGWAALLAGAQEQGARVQEQKPTVRFLEALVSLLHQQRVRLEEKSGGGIQWIGGALEAELLGWYDTDYLYLIPGAGYNRVARFLRDQGERLGIDQRTLRKYLSEESVLESREGRYNFNARINGAIQRVIKLDRRKVEELAGELPNTQGQATI